MHQHQNAPQITSDDDEIEIADEIDEIIEEILAARLTPPQSQQ